MLFSVVIPVYNVEKYIEECLESIIPQINELNEDCEILLIDDGSTDSSGKICDMYKKKFPQIIKVFHNINQGLLLTRRFGFKHAQGDYIINCDSDDMVEDSILRRIQEIIKKYNFPDIIIFNHFIYDEKNKKIAFENIFTENKECVVEKKMVLKEYLTSHRIVSVWGKIVKRECIDINRNYSEFGRISTGEDTLQSIEFFTNANTFVYLNEPLYDYRCGSGMTAKFDSDYYFTFKKIFEQIVKQKDNWAITDFDMLFSIKVLQIAGRAITQSRYKKWNSAIKQKEYLKKIRDDSMLLENYLYLGKIKNELQFDHYVLLKLLKNRLYMTIIVLLNIKNFIGSVSTKRGG